MAAALAIAGLSLTGAACGPDVYATYDNGKVTEDHVADFDAIFNLGARLENPDMKRRVVRDLALIEILSAKAEAEEIQNTELAQYFLGFAEKDYAREYITRKKMEEQELEKARVYRASHILLKVSNPDASPHMSPMDRPPVDPAIEGAVLDKISELRAKILSGEIAFEDAAISYSNDPGSSRKQGDLGYFTKGTMDPEFQAAIERLSGEASGTPLRVRASATTLYSAAAKDSAPIADLSKGQIVVTNPAEGDSAWVKATSGDQSGYIQTADLVEVESEKELSAPVRSMYGWHLIKVTFSEEISKKKYTSLVYDKDFKEVDNGKERAESMVNQYWERLEQQLFVDWQNGMKSKYGIGDQNMTLPADWKKQENLIKNENITVTSQDYIKFLESIATIERMEASELIDDEERVNQFFPIYVELLGFSNEAQKEGVYEEKDFQKRIAIQKKRFLANLYKQTIWESEIDVPEEQIRAEYDRYAKASQHTRQPAPPYKDVKERIRSRMLMSHVQEKENQLLADLNFMYNEDEFPEPEPPPQMDPNMSPGMPAGHPPAGHPPAGGGE